MTNKNTKKQSETLQTCSNYKLTEDNYYSNDTNQRYQSVSLFKSFLNCEEKTMAELTGKYQPDKNVTPLLVGNYLHSFFESPESHERFIQENEALIKTKSGAFKAEYKLADKMIKTLADDEVFNMLYQGDKEVIIQGQIDNVDWIGKVDCLNLDKKYFIDLKTTKNIRELQWNAEQHKKVTFIENYNYYIQLAVYRELIYQTFGVWCRPMIIAVSKEATPDKQAFTFDDTDSYNKMQDALFQMKDLQPHIQAVKNGEVKPTRCEVCDYCRLTKQLSLITPSQLEM